MSDGLRGGELVKTSETCARDVFQARVLGCSRSGDGGFLLRALLPRPLAQPLAGGQFFMLRTNDEHFPFLNRPFSVHDARPDVRGPELHFLFKAIGPGTGCLSRLELGQELTLVGPLGRPYPDAEPGVTSLLVAGGVGLPPLFLYLRRRMLEKRVDPAFLIYGARTRGQLFELDAARQLGVPVRTATEDGSDGLHGRVDKLLIEVLSELAGRRVRVLTCGPDPMMAAVARLCRERELPCLVTLETVMACGFGVCNACAVPLDGKSGGASRYARACIDGPVMDAAAILWNHARH